MAKNQRGSTKKFNLHISISRFCLIFMRYFAVLAVFEKGETLICFSCLVIMVILDCLVNFQHEFQPFSFCQI